MRHPSASHKEVARICNIDYAREMTFVMACEEFLMGMLEVKKTGRDFAGKQTIFVHDPDVIAFAQKHLLDAMVDYTTDES